MPKKTPEKHLEVKLPVWVAAACTACGKCCTQAHYMRSLPASADDVARWRREEREDILEYLDVVGIELYELWFKDGEPLQDCPFVKKKRGKNIYQCAIYETRPEVCRKYPVKARQMVELGCEIVGEIERVADLIRQVTPRKKKPQ